MDINIKVKSQAESASKALNRTKTAVSGLGSSYRKTGKETEAFYAKTKKLNNSFNNITKDANRTANSLANVGKSMKGLNQLMGMGKMYAYGQGLAQVIQSAVDMIEQTNLFNVAMGDLAVKTGTFVDKMHEAYGFDTTNMESAIGTYNLLARSMGMTSEQAQTLSTNMYKLAVDYSSLTNVPLNQVMQDFRSGLVGQTETVYKYGLDITEATLKQEAYLKGIDKSVRNMSQGEKMALRYSAMIRQSSLAQGDFARTINTPANQLKIMTERFVTLSRSIGAMFIPALTAVMPYVNAFLEVLNKLFQAIARLFGYTPPEVKNGVGNQMGTLADDAENAGGAIDGATEKLKKLKQVTLGMDELNVIPDQTDSGANGDGTSGAGVSPVGFDLTGYDNMMDSITQKSDIIAQNIEKALNAFKKMSLPLINADFTKLKDSAIGLWNALKPLAGKIGEGLAYFYTDVVVPLGVWLIEKGLPSAVDVLASALNAIKEALEFIEPYAKAFIEKFIKPLAFELSDSFLADLDMLKWAFDGIAWVFDKLNNNGDKVHGTLGKIIDKMTPLIELVLLQFLPAGSEIIFKLDDIRDAFVLAKDKIAEKWEDFGTWFGEKVVEFGVAKELLKLALEDIKTSFSATWDRIKEVWGTVKEWFTTNVATPLGSVFKGIANTVIGYWNNIISSFESALNFIIGGINSFIRWIDELVQKVNSISNKIGVKVKFSMSPIGNVTLGRVPQLANGGMLERGQLFEAGEFGKAEMLGSYNNKTTVMPLENTGFVDAIYNAVYDAVSKAGDNGGAIIENVLNLDGEVIYKNQQKVASGRGVSFDMGVFKR